MGWLQCLGLLGDHLLPPQLSPRARVVVDLEDDLLEVLAVVVRVDLLFFVQEDLPDGSRGRVGILHDLP